MQSIKMIIAAVLVMAGMSVMGQTTDFLHDGTNLYYTGGNVGIGTNSPSTILNVHNNTTAYLQVESPYDGTGVPVHNISALWLKNSSSEDLVYMGLRKRQGSHDMVQSVFDAAANGGAGAWREFIYFHFNTQKYEMRAGIKDAEFKNSGNILFNNTGSVGIGMGVATIPSEIKLAVNGKINAKEIEVTLLGWPDYVFNDDYDLLPLGDVKDFITINKHLPGVPSEQEVLKNGVNLGEMDAMLLKKIEELTLYMIELKEENQELRTIINELK